MSLPSKAVFNRRPASWIKAETEGNTWNGEILSIFPKPLEYASLAIGLEAEAKDRWYTGVSGLASAMATFAVVLLSWAVTAFSHAPNGAQAGAGLASVLMR